MKTSFLQPARRFPEEQEPAAAGKTQFAGILRFVVAVKSPQAVIPRVLHAGTGIAVRGALSGRSAGCGTVFRSKTAIQGFGLCADGKISKKMRF